VPTVLRILLLRLLPGRLFPLIVAYEVVRLVLELLERRRAVQARDVSPTNPGAVVVRDRWPRGPYRP
jgi:hypothetical protein